MADEKKTVTAKEDEQKTGSSIKTAPAEKPVKPETQSAIPDQKSEKPESKDAKKDEPKKDDAKTDGAKKDDAKKDDKKDDGKKADAKAETKPAAPGGPSIIELVDRIQSEKARSKVAASGVEVRAQQTAPGAAPVNLEEIAASVAVQNLPQQTQYRVPGAADALRNSYQNNTNPSQIYQTEQLRKMYEDRLSDERKLHDVSYKSKTASDDLREQQRDRLFGDKGIFRSYDNKH